MTSKKWDVEEGEIEQLDPRSLEPHPANEEIYDDRLLDDVEDESFVQSVREKGVLEPVVVDHENTIISGHRRVEAAKRASVETVPVRVQQYESELSKREALVHYNRQREKTFSQKMREAEALEEIERERARDRQGTRTDTSSSDEQDVENTLTRDEVAEEIGFGSGTTFHRARTVWEAHQSDDAKVAAIAEEQIEQLNADEQSISGAYAEVKNEQQRAERAQADTSSDQPTATKAEAASKSKYLQADASALPLSDEVVDIIVTSPPYNLGHERWTMGWRSTRTEGIGYFDDRPEDEYREWQIEILRECFRVAREGASFFYVHKVRIDGGEVTHPIEWLLSDENPWSVRQEIVWNRQSTHNHEPTLFRPLDERVYWLTKGTPTVPDDGIELESVWDVWGPRPDTEHPAPFPEEIPQRCIEAVGTDGDIVLDPMGGSMTTCRVASELGYENVGVDLNREYIDTVRR